MRGSLINRHLLAEVYFPNQTKTIARLIEQEVTLIASDADDLTHIIGFVCGRDVVDATLVHFCYVKAPLRNWGIGRALITSLGWKEHKPVIATAYTSTAVALSYKLQIIFNPYILAPYMSHDAYDYVMRKVPK